MYSGRPPGRNDGVERRLTATMAAIIGGDLLVRVVHYLELLSTPQALALGAVVTFVPIVLLARHVSKEEGRSLIDVLRRPAQAGSVTKSISDSTAPTNDGSKSA